MIHFSNPVFAGKENNPKSVMALSAEFLAAIKANNPTERIVDQLASMPAKKLATELDTDAKKKTFWINTYNSYILLLLRKNPNLYEDRSAFFKKKRIKNSWIDVQF